MTKEILSVQNLSISFKEIPAVQKVSFSLYEGESLAIVGESGCGKTTLVKALMGLNSKEICNIPSGQILYNGTNLLELNPMEMRKIRGKEIGMIFQDPMASLNPTMKVGKQVMESYLLHHPQASKKMAKAKVLSIFHLLGIPDPEARFHLYPFELSGGMRQRIMISIALAGEPNILIADEPTTSLDVTIQAQILEELKNIQRQMGTSIIFITHDLSLVAGFCSRILVMYGGRIVEMADTKTLFSEPKHPYTQKLLASIPSLALTKNDKLIPIDGSPPSPFDLISGCPFHPRCPFKTDQCLKESPELKSDGSSHFACYNPKVLCNK